VPWTRSGPIVQEAGGYRLLETFRLGPMQFTADEVLTLMAALDFARRRRVLGGDAAASAIPVDRNSTRHESRVLSFKHQARVIRS